MQMVKVKFLKTNSLRNVVGTIMHRGIRLNVRRILIWFFITAGIFLRLKQFLSNRALWIDEASLAMNIIDRPFSGLFQLLDYTQGAPVGFLMVEKLAIRTLGSSEYVLRLFPFICGIASIFIFYKVAQYYLDKNAVPVAVFLFSFSKGLIYYASETKQYSSDVAVTLLLFLVAIYVQTKPLNIFRMAAFAFIGAIAIWFSHPAIFILISIGTSLCVACLSNKDIPKVFSLLAVWLLWLMSFAVCYFVNLKGLINLKPMLDWWQNSFMSFPPNPIWLADSFLNFFQLHFNLSDIALLVFLIGGIVMFLKNKVNFTALFLPVIAVLAASAFHKFPFFGRLILFMVPITILFISQGVEAVRAKTFNYFPLLSVVLIGVLFFSVFQGALDVQTNTKQEEVKTVFSYLKEHKQKDDFFFVFFTPAQMFKYYSQRYGLGRVNIQGVPLWEDDELQGVEALKRLRGQKRVWILFFDLTSRRSFNKDKFFLYCADMMGTRLDFFKNRKAAAYLYDFNQEDRL